MKRKRKQRVMAILMSLLMVVGLIPTDLAVTTAKAATVTTTFTASTELANVLKSVAVPNGTVYQNYFTTFGIDTTDPVSGTVTNNTTKRGNSDTFSLEVGKAETSGLQFTTTGVATVTLNLGSTSSSNTSVFGLKALNGAYMTYSTGTSSITGKDAVTGTASTQFVYTGLPAGTYQIVSPNDTTYARGVRIYSVVVAEEISAGAKATISNVTSTLSGSTVNVNWSAVNGAGTEKTLVEYSNDNGTTWKTVASVNQDVTTTTQDLSTLPSGTYMYRVTGDSTAVASAAAVTWELARKLWSTVTAPSCTATQSDSNINVNWSMDIGVDGADSLLIEVLYPDTTVFATKKIDRTATTVTSGTQAFAGSASGNYVVRLTASRVSETDKVVASAATLAYKKALTAPIISSATSKGGGSVDLVWDAVNEATGYQVSYSTDGTTYSTPVAVSELNYTVTGLTVGTTYTFKVEATRGADVSPAATIVATASADAKRTWEFSAFGQGVSSSNVSYSGSVNEGTLRLWSLGGKGKLVPANTDGLGFYYTKVNKDTNFTLTAKLHVNSWTYSNGQEGFGLMAADAVGKKGDSSVFWNNSYMLSATKVEYFYDAEAQAVTTDSTKPKISMKIGVGAQEKKGVTLSNLAKLQASDTATVQNEFKTVMNTLESSCGNLGAGSYNIIGNATAAVEGTQSPAYTDITVTIKRDNTGYRMMFTDKDGNVLKKTYYDYEGTNLTQLDDSIYVGFFTSRNADVSVSDVSFTTINRSEDAAPELPETTYIVPVSSVTSTASTGISDYNLTFVSNSDGVVTVKDPDGNVIVDAKSVKANEVVTAPTYALTKGTSKFTVTYKPNSDYIPGQYQLLSSYDEITIEHSVTYKTYGAPGQSIWVSPTATSSGSGSTTDPMDIYTAVKYVQPGQTIVLKEGTYNLQTSLTIARGVSGTESNLITMVADPAATSRPVFDFGKVASGMTIGGDYWYLQGFDVTNSSNGQKGIQVAGKNNTLDQVNAYHNGNTGIQISRLLGTDLWDNWPANNLILNCTSYGNADAGYEDADGFAAKLTIAEGNVFRGCIAHNNADDGWDLFAKVESGTIGKVVIDNCIAYSNGVLEDGTNAGNGNGFKLGGSSMVGAHELRNSIAYNNKAKGIDSNSCPDIQVYNCTTFNNGSFNVALYTSDAKNTNFTASGILSFRTVGLTVREEIKLRGTQDVTKVINSNNYFWDQVEGKSVNTFSAASFAPASALSVQTVNGTAVFAPSLATIPTEASSSWFTSLDTTIVPTRDADGSINMNGLLTLTASAPANVGARLIATPSKAVAIPVSVKTGDTTHLYFFFTLSIMSGAALLGLYFYDKKRKTFVSR